MNRFVDKYLNGFLSVLLLGYYLALAWILHRSGYEHSENLFMAEKIKTLFESSENTLVTLGTTFPSVVYLSSLVFTPFGYLFAPILASLALTVSFFFTLLIDFKETSKLPSYIYVPLVCLIFFFHPGIIYAAISGRGVAALLLFFYLLFRSLFRYYKTQTTFFLSMGSIYLTALVFCDFNFIWLLLAFFPFIVLVSLEGLKIDKFQVPIWQYFEAVNNRSQRRKLINRALAIYVVLFLLPIGTLLLFAYLNDSHAGIADHFLHSQYANWHVLGNIPIGDVVEIKNTNVLFQSQFLFQFYVIFLNPLLILSFFLFKGKLYELFTLLAPFILMGILLINLQQSFLIEYYLIFLVLAMLGLSFYAGSRFTRKATWFVVFIVAWLNVVAGIYYFNHTADVEEREFFNALKTSRNLSSKRNINEDEEIAAYISDIADINNKVLVDDAAAFQIVAHLKSLEGILMPTDKSFGTVIENPIVGVRYLCVAKIDNAWKNFTVMNAYNVGQMENRGLFRTQMMFETKNWEVLRLSSVED